MTHRIQSFIIYRQLSHVNSHWK